jgi:Flp pilus assembly protein TadB
VDADTAVTIIIGVGAVASAILTPRSIRTMRRGDDDWRRRWRALEPAHREEIVRALRRGEPLTDPADAELGTRAVAQLDHIRRAMRPIERLGIVVLAALLIAWLIGGRTVAAIIVAATLAFVALLDVVLRRRRRRMRRSVG